jgi:hypothetical protein
MLRATSVLVALFAYAGLAVAECGAAHEAKSGATSDQQVHATQVPVAKTTKHIARKSTKAACEGNNCDAARTRQVAKVESAELGTK